MALVRLGLELYRQREYIYSLANDVVIIYVHRVYGRSTEVDTKSLDLPTLMVLACQISNPTS